MKKWNSSGEQTPPLLAKESAWIIWNVAICTKTSNRSKITFSADFFSCPFVCFFCCCFMSDPSGAALKWIMKYPKIHGSLVDNTFNPLFKTSYAMPGFSFRQPLKQKKDLVGLVVSLGKVASPFVTSERAVFPRSVKKKKKKLRRRAVCLSYAVGGELRGCLWSRCVLSDTTGGPIWRTSNPFWEVAQEKQVGEEKKKKNTTKRSVNFDITWDSFQRVYSGQFVSLKSNFFQLFPNISF